jgi:hypothetical protein
VTNVQVFFYGLFMDEGLLAAKGIRPSEVSIGYVNGYALRIGQRATLVRCPDSRAYGVLMDIAADEAEALYADDSVADSLPEPVTVELVDGARVEAACYNLPGDKVTGSNKRYAELLLGLATRLHFPASYLEEIRQARN